VESKKQLNKKMKSRIRPTNTENKWMVTRGNGGAAKWMKESRRYRFPVME